MTTQLICDQCHDVYYFYDNDVVLDTCRCGGSLQEASFNEVQEAAAEVASR